MLSKELAILKGIHPGAVLERELKKRKLAKGLFALSINEYPQTLSAIINGKRNMNTPLAMKIEDRLGIEEGFFMTLQIFYDIAEEKKRSLKGEHPDLSILRPVLFWDTEMGKIDWQRNKAAVIERVFERGNEEERNEITRFYGQSAVKEILTRNTRTNK